MVIIRIKAFLFGCYYFTSRLLFDFDNISNKIVIHITHYLANHQKNEKINNITRISISSVKRIGAMENDKMLEQQKKNKENISPSTNYSINHSRKAGVVLQ